MSDTAKARYDTLKLRREPFLCRARECSRLTIPALIPPEGFNYAMTLPQPWQGLGARAVVNLSSRLMMALMPAGRNFMRLGVTAEAQMAAGEQSVPADLEVGLALTEAVLHKETERRGWRQPTNLSLQHLIVGGNVMEQMLPNNAIRIYRLDQYVVVRDSSGNLTEFVIEELLAPDSLPDNLREIHESSSGTQTTTTNGTDDKSVALYTHGKLVDGEWTVHQELGKDRVPDSEGTFELDKLPFFPLRWAAIAGEDYGRSKVEEHLPDLLSLDGLSKAMVDGAAMASRNVILVRPNAAGGVNLKRKIAKANNGDFVIGNPEDVEMLQFTNTNGLQITQVEIEALRQEIGAAFLLGSATTRNAERVTAYEIRQQAQELEGILGGVYSMLSQEMLQRRVSRLIFQMQANEQLPDFPDDSVEPTILTGLEALGREAQVENVVGALQMLNGFPPEVLDYVKWDVMLKKGFNGLNLSDAARSETEAQQVRDQRQQTELLQSGVEAAAGPVAQAAAGAIAQPAQ